MVLFGVRGVLEMIVSHRAPSSLDISPYGAIWIHFRENSINFLKKSLGPGPGSGPGPWDQGLGPGPGSGFRPGLGPGPGEGRWVQAEGEAGGQVG